LIAVDGFVCLNNAVVQEFIYWHDMGLEYTVDIAIFITLMVWTAVRVSLPLSVRAEIVCEVSVIACSFHCPFGHHRRPWWVELILIFSHILTMYLESSYSDNGADSISSNIAPQLVLGLYGSNYITVKELQNLLNDVLFQRPVHFALADLNCDCQFVWFHWNGWRVFKVEWLEQCTFALVVHFLHNFIAFDAFLRIIATFTFSAEWVCFFATRRMCIAWCMPWHRVCLSQCCFHQLTAHLQCSTYCAKLQITVRQ